jgi:putative addiction module killer protein
MYALLQTAVFSDWLHALRDRAGVGVIVKRVTRMGAGNLGDVKNLGEGLSEARIFFGPGYRLYILPSATARSSSCCAGATREARSATSSARGS